MSLHDNFMQISVNNIAKWALLCSIYFDPRDTLKTHFLKFSYDIQWFISTHVAVLTV